MQLVQSANNASPKFGERNNGCSLCQLKILFLWEEFIRHNALLKWIDFFCSVVSVAP